jgi:Integrase core domain
MPTSTACTPPRGRYSQGQGRSQGVQCPRIVYTDLRHYAKLGIISPMLRGSLLEARSPSTGGLGRRKPLSAQTTGSVSRTACQANTRHRRLRVLKTPPQAPQANAICERVLGTPRQECLDWMIPLTETHLRHMVREWVRHYNAGRPHMSLGPGIPQPLASLPVPVQTYRHRLPEHLQVVAYPILGGLHHDYRLEEKAA